MDSCGFPLATVLVDGRAAGEPFRGEAASGSQAKAWVSAAEAVAAASRSPADPPRRIKSLARDGIPPALRGHLWPALSGGAALQAAAGAGAYEALLARHGLLAPAADPEAWDVLPSHPAVGGREGAAAVRRLALATAASRGMLHPPRPLAMLAGFLLAVMGLSREEAAYWTLAGLLAHRLPRDFYDADMAGAALEQGVMHILLQARRPAVWERVAGKHAGVGPGPGCQARPDRDWVACLFINALPPDTTARVFDCLMVEGVKVLHRMALALCTLHSSAVLACVGDRAAPAVLRWRVAHTTDADALVRCAFRGVGTLTRAGLLTLRAAQQRDMHAAEASAAARLARLVARKAPSEGAGDARSAASAATSSCATPPTSADSAGTAGAAEGASPRRTQAAALRLLLARPQLVTRLAASVQGARG
ncbi:hypothetical protein ACKKBG_A22600 [Auxenochlorella protothecoides x Auxenochlorella symbiontica]